MKTALLLFVVMSFYSHQTKGDLIIDRGPQLEPVELTPAERRSVETHFTVPSGLSPIFARPNCQRLLGNNPERPLDHTAIPDLLRAAGGSFRDRELASACLEWLLPRSPVAAYDELTQFERNTSNDLEVRRRVQSVLEKTGKAVTCSVANARLEATLGYTRGRMVDIPNTVPIELPRSFSIQQCLPASTTASLLDNRSSDGLRALFLREQAARDIFDSRLREAPLSLREARGAGALGFRCREEGLCPLDRLSEGQTENRLNCSYTCHCSRTQGADTFTLKYEVTASLPSRLASISLHDPFIAESICPNVCRGTGGGGRAPNTVGQTEVIPHCSEGRRENFSENINLTVRLSNKYRHTAPAEAPDRVGRPRTVPEGGRSH